MRRPREIISDRRIWRYSARRIMEKDDRCELFHTLLITKGDARREKAEPTEKEDLTLALTWDLLVCTAEFSTCIMPAIHDKTF